MYQVHVHGHSVYIFDMLSVKKKKISWWTVIFHSHTNYEILHFIFVRVFTLDVF